jgi:hypothetical protein
MDKDEAYKELLDYIVSKAYIEYLITGLLPGQTGIYQGADADIER